MNDLLGRPLRNLRLSVTDRCNLRCEYCMPEDDYVWLPREDVLHFEEISALVDVFLSLGVDKIRLTGGEPLLRRDLAALVAMIARKPGLKDLALTTNGILLSDQIDGLAAAGLGRITVSLDTLRRDRFVKLTRADQRDAVLAGIESARRVFGRLKIDTVVIRGVNDDEIVPLVEYGRSADAEVRFIEYMDVGGASRWSPDRVVPRREILDALAQRYGAIAPLDEPGSSAPAERFALADGTTFGIIASTTEPFCRTCDRSRLTADGMWYLCLYATRGIDLRAPLRGGASPEALRAMIAAGWRGRDDRGAEERVALGDRRAFVPVQDLLRKDPHLEMHTRGG
ncbi:MAG TPA: GTP 3',8-cyclase MoaA [Vicinamibacterales bacterium]|nr:GTP 3',8-cyclase MoaA [Vicinamibacterales bacterium]